MANKLGTTPRVGLAVALVCAASVSLAGPASADTRLGVGQLIPLNHALEGVSTPGDPRLDGFAFSGRVLHAGVVGRLGTQKGAITPGRGERIAVFDVSVTEYSGLAPEASFLQLSPDQLPDPSFTLVAGAEQVDLPVHPGSGGSFENAWAVGVPVGVPVEVIVSRDGFSQAFSLGRRALVPPVPLAMYRDPASPVPSVEPKSVQSLYATNPDGTAVGFSLSLDRVALSYFSPDPGVPPPPPDRAFLVAQLTGTVGDPPEGWIPDGPLDPGLFHLQLPDGTSVPASYGMNWYWFPVPANVTQARLTLGPGAGQVQAYYPLRQATVQLTTPASFSFSLPAPAGKQTGRVAPRHPSQPKGSGLSTWGWLVALVVVGAAVIAVRARRRRRPDWPPTLTLDRTGPQYSVSEDPQRRWFEDPSRRSVP